MPGKVANKLPAEQYAQLLAELAALSAEPTLPQIVEVCGRFGIRVSERGGATTVRGDFEDFIAGINRRKDAAQMIAEAGNNGVTAADAGLAVATDKILTRLMEEEPDDETLQGAVYALARAKKSKDDTALLAARLRESDAKLRAFEQKETEWKEAREKLSAQVDKLRTATPATADEIRAKVVAEIDKIMGIPASK